MTNATLATIKSFFGETQAPEIFEVLIDTYPQHQETIQSCIWMGVDSMADGSLLHHFKHCATRNSFTFRPEPNGGIGGTIVGRIETGEESSDADAVFSQIDKL